MVFVGKASIPPFKSSSHDHIRFQPLITSIAANIWILTAPLPEIRIFSWNIKYAKKNFGYKLWTPYWSWRAAVASLRVWEFSGEIGSSCWFIIPPNNLNSYSLSTVHILPTSLLISRSMLVIICSNIFDRELLHTQYYLYHPTLVRQSFLLVEDSKLALGHMFWTLGSDAARTLCLLRLSAVIYFVAVWIEANTTFTYCSVSLFLLFLILYSLYSVHW